MGRNNDSKVLLSPLITSGIARSNENFNIFYSRTIPRMRSLDKREIFNIFQTVIIRTYFFLYLPIPNHNNTNILCSYVPNHNDINIFHIFECMFFLFEIMNPGSDPTYLKKTYKKKTNINEFGRHDIKY